MQTLSGCFHNYEVDDIRWAVAKINESQGNFPNIEILKVEPVPQTVNLVKITFLFFDAYALFCIGMMVGLRMNQLQK